jgi:hypothetical protein
MNKTMALTVMAGTSPAMTENDTEIRDQAACFLRGQNFENM